MSTALGVASLGNVYDQHIPAVAELLSALTIQHYVTFTGGALLKLDANRYAALLLPPVSVSEMNLAKHLENHFDGEWFLDRTEYAGQVELWHLVAPWAEDQPAA